MKPVIAYVDDDPANLDFYRELLHDSFEVETFARSLDLAKILDEKEFDCFILDIYMPVIDGFQLLERIRERPGTAKTPVFFVTANPCDEVKVTSYRKGAADFFDRMVKRDELVARLEARIKSYRETGSSLKLGRLCLDLHKIDCYLNGEKLILTLIEFKILCKLIQICPTRILKGDLVKAIWGGDAINANNLNSHLYNLRMKLADWDYEIDNHRFQGFGIEKKTNS